GMIDAYMSLLAQHRGEVTAQVVSAHALDEGQMTALADALKNAAGRDVQIETRVDNEILGGLIVRMGSRMIDSSLRTKLTNLQVAMKEVG
ncbi:MAG TPA: ATP synthase F1 subunit delta, partial [Alphaproteobacteria bacterium]|nr:ATP synthase F1 subunit delta [Alphaproteobacteria bacterium]